LNTEKSAVSVAESSWRSRRSAVIASVTSVIRSSEVTLTPIVRIVSPATKYFWTEASGTRTWSSGLLKPAPPFGWRIPMTWNGRPSIVTVAPSEVASRPRSLAVVAPRTATRRPCSTAASVRNDPCHTS
jgi:hypothetical protein